MQFHYAILFSATLSTLVSALALNGPLPTHRSLPYVDNHYLHDAPESTEGPKVHHILRRLNPQKTLLAAPDQTCGYFNGSSGQPWGCSTGNCVFAATTTAVANITSTGVGSVLCCDPKTGCPSSPAPTACVDKGRNDYNTTCTGSCPDDPATLKCTSGIYLYCNTISFQMPQISAYFCNYISTYEVLAAETTFSGQAGRSFTPTIAQFAVSSITSQSSISQTSTSSSLAVATKAPTATKKPVNKKAIIGGTIGGLMGLAVVLGATLVFRRWRNSPQNKVKKIVSDVDGNTTSPASETVNVERKK